jgi:response regulator RpfG family c-di-GMP phosphodiesterase
MAKAITLTEAKQLAAEAYGKRNWEAVKYDFEYGLGLSKAVDSEEVMDTVAEIYRKRDTSTRRSSKNSMLCNMNAYKAVKTKYERKLTDLKTEDSMISELIQVSHNRGDSYVERAGMVQDSIAIRGKIQLVEEFLADLPLIFADGR